MIRLGVALMLLSAVLLVAVPIAPFVSSSAGAGAAVAGALFVASEIAFWLGVAAVGRETWQAARRHGWKAVPSVLWERCRRS